MTWYNAIMPGAEWPLALHITLFLLAAGAIGVAGTKLAGLADRLADRTGLGEALTGTVFLGLITALPGITASVTAALEGYPGMAIANAMGGIAVQTAFLAVADLFHRGANLEHAAASVQNMLQSVILIMLLTLVAIGLVGPDVTVAHVHPMTPILFIVAGGAFVLVTRAGAQPMWKPTGTEHTVVDRPAPGAHRESLRLLVTGVVVTGAVVLASGAVAAHTAGEIAARTGISQTIMGGIALAVATSLPELVTTIAAVRRGALTLAVSDIIGGNFFDVLFVCIADLAFLKGSLYHAPGVRRSELFLTVLTILMNVVLLAGLIYRQKRGPANIGFESALVLVIYLAGMVVISLTVTAEM